MDNPLGDVTGLYLGKKMINWIFLEANCAACKKPGQGF